MRTVGHVVSVDGEFAEVVLGRYAECKRCGACLAKIDAKERRIRTLNPISADVGARVEVEIEPVQAVGSAFLIFIMPLIILVGAGFAGYRIGGNLGFHPVTLAAVGGVVGLGSSVLILRYLDRSVSGRRPTSIVGILADEVPPEGRCSNLL
jgi:sigma-E factor negative regulatory protein RseC